MRSQLTSRAVLCLAVLALINGSARGLSVYGEEVPYEDLTGSRSVGAGLATDIPTWDDTAISWEISRHEGYYLYVYRFMGFHGKGASISHITLDLTDDAVIGNTLKPGTIWDVTITDLDTGLPCWSPVLEGELNGGDIHGSVKVECPEDGDWPVNSELSFRSERGPVYGDVFVKAGIGSLWNLGWASADDATAEDFIARPNGHVPEPLTVLAVFLGAAAVANYVHKHRAT